MVPSSSLIYTIGTEHSNARKAIRISFVTIIHLFDLDAVISVESSVPFGNFFVLFIIIHLPSLSISSLDIFTFSSIK